MSDEEFDLKKKKKKSKKVDFDAFETEDAPNDGGDAGGVAAAVAEKIEDLDRTCFSLVLGFSLSSFLYFFLNILNINNSLLNLRYAKNFYRYKYYIYISLFKVELTKT